MFSATSLILCLTFLNFNVLVQCTPELPAEDSYGIVVTEWAIRNTVNKLFSTLKLKVMQQRLKLKQYSTIHNFFASITLRDRDNLNNIAKLTQVDNIDNGTLVFITQLNEVLNEDNKSDEATDSAYVNILIEEFINRLDKLKESNDFGNTTKFDLNKAILRHFSKNEIEFGNITYLKEELRKGNDSHNNNNVLSDSEFWQPSGRRIFDGKSAGVKQFPFMASVQFFKKFQCGGSIITSDLIITSASCLQLAWNNRFFRENPAFLSVHVGSTSFESGGENIPVMEIYFHPDFNPKSLRHNLAIMRLTRKLKFSRTQSRIKRILFDKNPWPVPSNIEGIVIVGWGAKTFGKPIISPMKNKLSHSTLEFYPLDECQEIYTKEFVTDRNFCAGFYSKGGGACNHDAGGPGVSGGTLLGVISFGAPVCGTPDAPTVFTKLGYYADWIDEILEMDTAVGSQQTTLRTLNYATFDFTHTTKPPFKVMPIIREELKTLLRKAPKSHKYDLLKENDQKQEFKDFVKTMFKKVKQAKTQTEQQLKKREEQKEEVEEKTEDDKAEEEKTEEGKAEEEKTEEGKAEEEKTEEGKAEEEKTEEEKNEKEKTEEEKKEEEKTEEETEELTISPDEAHYVKEVEQSKLKQALRNKPETEKKKEAKQSSRKPTSKRKKKMEFTSDSQSQSKEALEDNSGTVRPCTSFGSNKDKVTILHDNYDASPEMDSSSKEFTPSFKQRSDVNKKSSIGEETEFDAAIDSLIDDLNIRYISESKKRLPAANVRKDPLRANTKDKHPNLTEEKPSHAIRNKNINKDRENESDGNNGSDREYENDSSSENEGDEGEGTDENRNNEKSSSNHKTMETANKSQSAINTETHNNENHEKEHTEELAHNVNENSEENDYDMGETDDTDEDFETLSIPANSVEQENSSSNSTERPLEMTDYEYIYKLLSGHQI